MSSTQCNFKMMTSFAVIAGFLVFLTGFTEQAEARGKSGAIEREADCHRDKACLEEYARKKSDWLTCLESAGLSEKKRHKLSAKVEAIGIHGLKRQEILNFNSKRKACNNDFMKSLSEIHLKKEIEKDKNKNTQTAPSSVPDLLEKKEKL